MVTSNRGLSLLLACIVASPAFALLACAGDCNRCNLPESQGGCKCDANCDCIGGGGGPAPGGGNKCDKCNLPADKGGCKCDANCDCAGGGGGPPPTGGKCDKCNLPADKGGCKCDANCDCAGGGGGPPPTGGNKCDKCNLPTDKGGCKCDTNCDCPGGGAANQLTVKIEFGADKVWVTNYFYRDLISRANFQRVNQGRSTQEVQDGNGATLTFVVETFGDQDMNAWISSITKQAAPLGKSFIVPFWTNPTITDPAFDYLPSSVVITAYLGNRVAAQYSIYRTAAVPPAPGACDKTLGNAGTIFGAVAGTMAIAGAAGAAAATAPGAAAAAASAITTGGQIAGATGGVLNVLQIFQC